MVYHSIDGGKCVGLDNHIPTSLHLKVGAPVILLANMSNTLVNGLQGTVEILEEDGPTIKFPSISQSVKLSRYTFSVFSKDQMKDIGFRKQIPLNLAFGLTVHKAQGMSIERVVVDCRHMFTPGQIGVAIGRARSKKGLRIVNFDSKILKRHSQCVENFYCAESVEPVTDISCCGASYEYESEENVKQDSEVHEQPSVDIPDMLQDVGEDLSIPSEQELCDIFGDTDTIDSAFESVECAETQPEILSTDWPSDIDLIAILEGLVNPNPEMDEQVQDNQVCQYLLNHRDLTLKFAAELWRATKNSYEHVAAEKDVPLADIKKFYVSNYAFMSSARYKQLLKDIFHVEELERQHCNIAFKLATNLRLEFLRVKAKPILEAERNSITKGKNYCQSDAGRGVIRYIGGWCIATMKHVRKQNIRRNLYSLAKKDMVYQLDSEVKYIEALEAHIGDLHLIAKDQASLEITKIRQNKTGGLTNITDEAYEFFTDLDVCVRSLETRENLHLHGSDFYTYVFDHVLNDKNISKKWSDLFHLLDPNEEVIYPQAESTIVQDRHPVMSALLSSSTTVEHVSATEVKQPTASYSITDHEDKGRVHTGIVSSLYREVCTKYVRMSSGQFRRQYMREIKADKQEAHRKQIRMRKSERATTFNFDTISSDKTKSKISTHRRLQAEIEADSQFLEKGKVFAKKHLLALCNAYSVKASKSFTNAKLAEVLTKSIIDAKEITFPEYLFTESEGTGDSTQDVNVPVVQEIQKVQGNTSGKRVNKGKGKGKAKKSKTVEWPCGVCYLECENNAIECDLCDTWYHYECVQLDDNKVKYFENRDWYCSSCDDVIN